jgi:hypothetical protein
LQQQQPRTSRSAPPPVVQVTTPARDFFPSTVGSVWSYKGEGNEYASFTRRVLFASGARVQVHESTGGTVLAIVYEISDTAVRRVFRREEAYQPVNLLNEKATEDVVVLRTPFKVGATWDSGTDRVEITDVNATVNTPAGTFANCLVLKKTSREAADESVVREYYKAGVGLVLREFVSGTTRVTSSLESYDIKAKAR